jgi:hypothetical protein
VWNITKILGTSIEGTGHFIVFVDVSLFIRIGGSEYNWVSVNMIHEGVGDSPGELCATLQSQIFMMFA